MGIAPLEHSLTELTQAERTKQYGLTLSSQDSTAPSAHYVELPFLHTERPTPRPRTIRHSTEAKQATGGTDSHIVSIVISLHVFLYSLPPAFFTPGSRPAVNQTRSVSRLRVFMLAADPPSSNDLTGQGDVDQAWSSPRLSVLFGSSSSPPESSSILDSVRLRMIARASTLAMSAPAG
eukprot:CAMPEP_0115830522 /NCGR_PEP_ID=MMETSP0287-20121206/1658_2 /TAXON_ID=412157 /ORGANISM="Chrysochromulina rotalis, Strain UIO044" /LENGTH=177 /DNA_ID=CAMNT_0003283823 /DNA_START=176 /DNA_END=707 /DNA_ORIENTATION=-